MSRNKRTINFAGEVVGEIDALADTLGIDPTQVIMNALSAYRYLIEETNKGSVVAIHRPLPDASSILELGAPNADRRDFDTFIVPRD